LKKLTTEEFISKANLVHGEMYDYSISEYLNPYTKIKIICRHHGVFEQSHYSHLSGMGCSSCASSKKRMTTDDFIERSNKVHDYKYNYDSCIYINSRTKVDIICKTHGVFQQLPRTHIKQASGCPECGGTKKISQHEFISKCAEIHKNKYDYSKTIYSGMNKKITAACMEHGDFTQDASEHYRGRGCIECGKMSMGYGKDRFIKACHKNNGDALIYLLKCVGGDECFYKIGITSKTVKSRTINIPYKSELLSVVRGDGLGIFMKEKELHKKSKKYKYNPKIDFCGQTECFSEISSEVLEFFGVQS